eukprot:gb/GFBE01077765.1/.p1 GENE.gb/GFBE01077765.1/~~gb/GFBE01077765.1/.p1  ORF type:complete len:368 (+),score=88.24 gb/GFBE01077765.1/:1-1104(+)
MTESEEAHPEPPPTLTATQRLALHSNNVKSPARRRFIATANKQHNLPSRSTTTPMGHTTMPEKGGLWAATEKRHLEQEMQSLREAYARKIADTELNCERQLHEAEADREAWFKKKKVEVAKIRSGVVVMQALFERRKRRFMAQMAKEKEEFEERKVLMDAQLLAAQTHTVEVTNQYEAKIAEMNKAHEKGNSEARVVQKDTEERAFRAERSLMKAEADIKRMQEQERALRFEIEDLQVRLRDAERSEDLMRAREEAAALDRELKRTRREMQDRKHTEAEALRKELMEYVKFIVKILPDEWRSRLHPQLMQRLPNSGLDEAHPDSPVSVVRELDFGEGDMPPSPSGGSGAVLPPLQLQSARGTRQRRA